MSVEVVDKWWSIGDEVINPDYDLVTNNFARQLNDFQGRVLHFVKSVTKYRHEAATNILVVLISHKE